MINGSTINGADINGTELTDEEQYQLWLRDPTADVVHLVRVLGVGTDAYVNTVDLKLSDRPFAGYHAVVRSIPTFSRQIGESLGGQASGGIGNLVLDNLDESLDTWVRLGMDLRPIRILHGDPGWSEDRFRHIASGVIEGLLSVDESSITYRLRPQQFDANAPLQGNLVSSGPNTNALIPVTYGDVLNIEPVLLDEVNLIYQFHGGANFGAAQSVLALRVGGIDFNGGAIAISAVNAGTDTLSTATAHGLLVDDRVRFSIGTPPTPLELNRDYWVSSTGLTATDFRLSATRGGVVEDITGSDTGATLTGYHWTANLTAGTVQLSSATDGSQLTMDAVGYLNHASEILPHVLAAENVDQASVGIIDRLVGDDGVTPGRIGVYVRDRANRIAVADQIAAGLGIWYGYGRDGMFRMGRVISAYSATVSDGWDAGMLTIKVDDMASRVQIEKLLPMTWGNRLIYRKNWTRQSTLLSGVADEDRATYAAAGLIAAASEPATANPFYPSAVQPDVRDSVCAEAYTARQICNLADFNGLGPVPMCIASVEVGRIGAALDIGDRFFIEFNRWMQEANSAYVTGLPGYPCTVVGLDDNPSAGTTTVRFYTPIGELFPSVL